MLLDLPMELLQRITGYLRPEAVTAVRLTCKTLEGATFDRFVEQNCTFRRCFVLSAARWTRLHTQLKQSPRLASKVKRIFLTTNPYESLRSTHVQLAPEKRFQDIREAQYAVTEHANSNEGLSLRLKGEPRADLGMMKDVISEVQQTAPLATATLFIELPKEQHALCYDVVAAIVASRLAIRHLKIPRSFATAFEMRLAPHKQGFLDCTSSLESLDFGNQRVRPEYRRYTEQVHVKLFEEIFRSSRSMMRLTMCLGEYGFSHQSEAITRALLVGSNLSKLTRLRLDVANISEEVIRSVLTECKCTLKSVTIRWTRLVNIRSGWPGVLCMILDLPSLQYIHLEHIICGDNGWSCVSFEPVKQFDVTSGQRGHHVLIMRGRDVVVAGLRELLRKPLIYFQIT
jgi:hypothetical protein